MSPSESNQTKQGSETSTNPSPNPTKTRFLILVLRGDYRGGGTYRSCRGSDCHRGVDIFRIELGSVLALGLVFITMAPPTSPSLTAWDRITAGVRVEHLFLPKGGRILAQPTQFFSFHRWFEALGSRFSFPFGV